MTEIANVDFSNRQSLPGVDPQFTHRWSPRAMQRTAIPAPDLAAIFEAARWAPSCFNDQPWRFYTSTDATFEAYVDLLNAANQTWAKNAAVLGFVVSRQHFRHNGKPNAHADFDAEGAPPGLPPPRYGRGQLWWCVRLSRPRSGEVSCDLRLCTRAARRSRHSHVGTAGQGTTQRTRAAG